MFFNRLEAFGSAHFLMQLILREKKGTKEHLVRN